MNLTGFWWILGAGAIYGLLHSILASLTAKKLAVRWFGENGRKYYRFFYVVVACLSTPLYTALIFLLPDARLYTIPVPWVYLTLLVQLAAGICLLLSLAGTGVLSFVGLDVLFRSNPVPQKSKLKTTGFYAWMRHPIYFFTFVILWLFPVISWNMFAFVIGVTIYTLIGSLYEERRLVIEFGQEYLEYQKNTPWIIPIKLK
ncbi:MAG: hypothetical protein FD147_1033 [Chloroflexi bacterium]|nr:MAG: hypothetical protein FD147_1033 [Chloroflexota bacterium]MBA4374878.1 hypothetical protein [Anaerolinea sp.]